MAASGNPGLLIEIDGGVSQDNALALLKAGADVLVAGNAVFSSKDQEKAIADLKQISPADTRI
jgi:ribulose-phosphate 3-epimerase